MRKSLSEGTISFIYHRRIYGCFASYEAMVEAIEQQAPNYEPGTRCMYHTSTLWFLCGEIVRRVSGTPITGYWRREIAGDSGMDLTFDVLDGELPLLSPTVVPEDDPFNAVLNDESQPIGQAWRVLKPRGGRIDQSAAWNAPSTRRNGVSGFGNARGLAAMAGLFVNGGRLGSRRVGRAWLAGDHAAGARHGRAGSGGHRLRDW